jgi:hypothetical protein
MKRHAALGMGMNFLANYYLDVSQTDFIIEHGQNHSLKNSKKLSGFKYKQTKAIQATNGMPALFFRFDMSPVKVRYTYSQKSP